MNKWNYNTKNGICDFKFEKWEEFIEYFNDNLLECPAYIYRGQQIKKWKIISKIRRYIDNNSWLPPYKKLIELHKENFKYSIRDRVDFHNTTLETIKDDDLWSLGQHFGLATPLIDWTYSPFIAAYFAFIDPDLKYKQSKYRCIYVLHKMETENNQYLLDEYDIDVEVLKVSHHGAYNGTNEAFLDEVTPVVSVISSGSNSYGHPDSVVVGLLED